MLKYKPHFQNSIKSIEFLWLYPTQTILDLIVGVCIINIHQNVTTEINYLKVL
jgi:hypothetical protein